PSTRVAVGLFEVGNGLYISTRLLSESATNNRDPSEVTPNGRSKDSAVGGDGAANEVKSAWPTTTSAGAPFVVGMLFQISTRLLNESATTSFVPFDHTASTSPISVCDVPEPLLVKSG